MKTVFLKKVMPLAIVLVVGTAGAFLTTSMQSSKASRALVIGYADGPSGPCSVPVECENQIINEACRVSYPNGAIAKNQDNCTDVLFRPQN